MQVVFHYPLELHSTIRMFLIGITVGVISGYFGGIVDTLLMRITEFVMLFPFLIF